MIVSHHPANLTVVVKGSAFVNDVQDALKMHHQFIPIGPFCEGITIRDAINHNLIGSFSNQFGTIRNWLLNTNLQTSMGEFTTGADVMKNVSGYDLTRILIGSQGQLGVIVHATFKLLPISKQPEPESPIESGFRIITLPENYSALIKKLRAMSLKILGYESLGVIDILTEDLKLPDGVKSIQTEFKTDILEIRKGIPIVPELNLPSLNQRIIQLFEKSNI